MRVVEGADPYRVSAYFERLSQPYQVYARRHSKTKRAQLSPRSWLQQHCVATQTGFLRSFFHMQTKPLAPQITCIKLLPYRTVIGKNLHILLTICPGVALVAKNSYYIRRHGRISIFILFNANISHVNIDALSCSKRCVISTIDCEHHIRSAMVINGYKILTVLRGFTCFHDQLL